MSIGVELTFNDIIAIRRLFKERWTATIKNWKERGTDYCIWLISCPDNTGSYKTKTGQSLAATIEELLNEVGKAPPEYPQSFL